MSSNTLGKLLFRIKKGDFRFRETDEPILMIIEI